MEEGGVRGDTPFFFSGTPHRWIAQERVRWGNGIPTFRQSELAVEVEAMVRYLFHLP
jgi:hypothetical protein